MASSDSTNSTIQPVKPADLAPDAGPHWVETPGDPKDTGTPSAEKDSVARGGRKK